MPVANPRSVLRHSREVTSGRMTVTEIAQRLDIGRLKVYTMLEQRMLPGIWSVGSGSSRARPTRSGSAPVGRGFALDLRRNQR
jgi:excisionase family DNA binding protein